MRAQARRPIDGLRSTGELGHCLIYAPRAESVAGSVAFVDERADEALPSGSDRPSKFRERGRKSRHRRGAECKVVVAASQVLHEGVPGDDDLGRPIMLESAHRSQPAFELAVIRFDRIVRVPLDVVLPPALTLCPATVDIEMATEWMTDATAVGVEGIVVKDLADPYRPGRTRWRKVKTRTTTEAVIGGATGPTTSPTGLLLGRFDEAGRLHLTARTTRLTAAQSAELGHALAGLQWRNQDGSHPWPNPLPAGWIGHFGTRQPIDYTPLQPAVVVEVLADVAAEHGRQRHAVRYVRLRPEIDAHDVPFQHEEGVG